MSKNTLSYIFLFLVLTLSVGAAIYFAFTNPRSADDASHAQSSTSSASSTMSSSSTSSLSSTSVSSSPAQLPDDPYFDAQWNLKTESFGIAAKLAWPYERGEVIVAVIDNGFSLEHEDLKDVWWKNEREIPNNNKDDDQNGYVDDYIGYNIDSSNGVLTAATGHGTWVSGVIGAKRDNGKGIAGVCGACRILPVQYTVEMLETDADRALAAKKLGKAIDYAVKSGAQVINMSFVSAPSKELQTKISNYAAQGILFVAAAGNNNADLAQTAFYPATFKDVLTVAAIGNDGKKTDASNYGAGVEFAAPASLIPLTNPYTAGAKSPSALKPIYNTDRYATETANGGTSVAAPHLSGLLGIAKSCNSQISFSDVITAGAVSNLPTVLIKGTKTPLVHSDLVILLCSKNL